MDINTPEDWWTLFRQCEEDILNILWANLPMNEPPETESIKTIAQIIHIASVEKDHYTLLRYMNRAWFNAPETYCWSVPNWGNFCDLMSEDWVFYQEENLS